MNSTKQMIVAAVTSLAIMSSGIALSDNEIDTAPNITAKQAIDIALNAVPGVIHEVELEKERDAFAWEIELVSAQDQKEYEILIDANTGKVISKEIEEDHGKWKFFSFLDLDDDHR